MQKLRQALSNHYFIQYEPARAKALYAESAYQLNQLLLLPLKDILNEKQQVVLVPDYVLGQILFGSLLRSPLDPAKGYNEADFWINLVKIAPSVNNLVSILRWSIDYFSLLVS